MVKGRGDLDEGAHSKSVQPQFPYEPTLMRSYKPPKTDGISLRIPEKKQKSEEL